MNQKRTYGVVYRSHIGGNVDWIPLGLNLTEELERRKIKVRSIEEGEAYGVLESISEFLESEGWFVEWEEEEAGEWYELQYDLGSIWLEEEKGSSDVGKGFAGVFGEKTRKGGKVLSCREKNLCPTWWGRGRGSVEKGS
ncbi:MAG: hypothetical protein AB7J46_07760 [Candidatus Altimarinota bacterium]